MLVVGVGLFGFDFACDIQDGASTFPTNLPERTTRQDAQESVKLVRASQGRHWASNDGPVIGGCAVALNRTTHQLVHAARPPDTFPVISFPGPTLVELMALPGATAAQWDPQSSQPYFNYQNQAAGDESSSEAGANVGDKSAGVGASADSGVNVGVGEGDWHQVWYEDARSISVKRTLASTMGLGGMGCFLADFISGTTPRTASLWDALAGSSSTDSDAVPQNIFPVGMLDFSSFRGVVHGALGF
jgi:hypothetical protein